jgi:Domain of unknown function (DUF4159)
MGLRRGRLVACVVLSAAVTAWAFQKPFREYPGQEYNDFPVPPDYRDKTEFVFARLMYPDGYGGFGFSRRFADWREGYTNWTNDYPRSDRHLMVALRRLTRVQNRSVEQPVNLDDGDEVFNYPFLYMVRAGLANLTDAQIAKLREYLDRGGFLIGDDIWGDREYGNFSAATADRVLPNCSIVEVPDGDPAFHTVYDLEHRYQISGQWSLGSGIPYLNGGVIPHWRGIYDERQRLQVAIWVNNDTGDSWEWADDPTYPERYSALGIRIAVNYIVYAMTH